MYNNTADTTTDPSLSDLDKKYKLRSNFLEYLNSILSVDKVSDSNTLKLLHQIPPYARDFILHLFNFDLKSILKENSRLTDIEYRYSELVTVHYDYLNFVLVESLTTLDYNHVNFTKHATKVIKSLPFKDKSSFLYINTAEKSLFTSCDSLNQLDDYKTLPLLYLEDKIRYLYPTIKNNSNLTNLQILKVIEYTVSRLIEINPNYTLQPCKTIYNLFTQFYFLENCPQRLEDCLHTLDKCNPRYYLLNNNNLCDLIVENELGMCKEFHPILEIDKFNNHTFQMEILNCVKLPNNLKYTNAEIIALLHKYFALSSSYFRTTSSYNYKLYPSTYIQTFIYHLVSSIVNTPTQNLINTRHVAIELTSKLSFNPKNLVYATIFTPKQLNNFLRCTYQTQNRILELMNDVVNKRSNESLNELKQVAVMFVKQMYSYYCEINNLDATKPYRFVDEIKTYPTTPTLDSKLEDATKLVTGVNKGTDNLNILYSDVLSHYVDLKYPTEFLKALQDSGVSKSEIEKVYKGYLKELVSDVLTKYNVNQNERVSIHELYPAYEDIINSIPYHYIRLASLTTHSYLESDGLFRDIPSYLSAHIYNIIALEHISNIATSTNC